VVTQEPVEFRRLDFIHYTTRAVQSAAPVSAYTTYTSTGRTAGDVPDLGNYTIYIIHADEMLFCTVLVVSTIASW
jgi:hypothetical protein